MSKEMTGSGHTTEPKTNAKGNTRLLLLYPMHLRAEMSQACKALGISHQEGIRQAITAFVMSNPIEGCAPKKRGRKPKAK